MRTLQSVILALCITSSWCLALAEPSFEQERDLFCTNPFQSVCKDSAKSENDFKRMRQDLAQKASLSTLQIVGQQLTQAAALTFMNSIRQGTQDADSKNQRDIELKLELRDLKSFMLALKIYFSELEKLSPIKGKEATALVEKHKKLHIDRINAEPTFSKELKAKMVERIQKAEILTFARVIGFLEEKGIDWERDVQATADLITDLGTSCGPDFLRDNSSARGMTLELEMVDAEGKPFTRNERIEIVRFCPGAMLRSFDNSVAHEVSHLYDISHDQPDSYKVMAQCLVDEFSLNPGVTWMKETDEEKRRKLFWANFDEFFADFSAADTKATILKDERLAGTQAGLDRIRKDLVPYCSEPPGERHGSGQFRINHIYGANPALRKAAGCDMAKPQPVTCTLAGRHPAK